VVASVVLEGVLTGVFGAGIGMLAAVLPSAIVGNILASISNQALSLKLSGVGALLWLGFIVIAALVASYYPATRASQLTIKQTLDWETT
jgi:putative ABC transport system permease protein